MKENELIIAAQKGDTDSLDIIIDNYKPIVNSIGRKYFMVGGETEDLIQEGMIGLFKAIQTYNHNNTASFKTYAILLINRKVQDSIKNSNRKKHQMLNGFLTINNQGVVVTSNFNNDQGSETGFYIKGDQIDPEEYALSKERNIAIKKEIMTKLNQKEKDVLRLYIDGSSYVSISKKLDISTKKVDNILYSVRKKLRYLKNI